MFKKILSSVLFLAIAGTSAIFAQSRVALHHEGQVTIFGGAAPFADAYNAAVSGDTIYLPGGSFAAPAAIAKGIAIYGAGHYPDSTAVTLPTSVTGSVLISEGADNLRFEGILFTGEFTFIYNQKVDNVVISRCRINGNLTYNGTIAPCENHQISQCVIIGTVYFNNLQGSTITNCIIQGQIQNGNSLVISNNVVMFDGTYTPCQGCNECNGSYYNIKNSTVINNVHLRRASAVSTACIQRDCAGSTFSNNLIVAASPNFGDNTVSGNYLNVVANDMCVNAPDNVFDYTKDYHLQDPETYLGTDGTQVGIYGGALGYKPGAVPSNPHFSSATVAPTTNEEGKLNVNIKVIAQ